MRKIDDLINIILLKFFNYNKKLLTVCNYRGLQYNQIKERSDKR